MIIFFIIVFMVQEYLRIFDYFPILKTIHLGTVLPCLITLASVISVKGYSIKKVYYNDNIKILFAWCFLIMISVLFARLGYKALETFMGVFGYGLAGFFIAKNLTSEKKIKIILLTLIMINLSAVALSPEILENTMRSSSFLYAGPYMGDGNDFALSLSITLPFMIYFFKTSSSNMLKFGFGIASLINIAFIILTQSRGGALTLAGLGIFYISKSKNKLIALVLVMIASLLVFSFAPSQFFDRMSTIQDYENESSAMNRIRAWTGSFLMALDNPITGVGAGGFASAYGQFYRQEGFNRVAMNAHSVYFQILGELGFPGIFMILYLLIRNFKILINNRKILVKYSLVSLVNLNEALTGGLLAFCIGAAFLSVQYYPHIYFLIGLITAFDLLVSEQKQNLKI